jgi:hypothetical protein
MPISEELKHNDDPFIISHYGHRLGPNYPAPTVEDIAVSLGRICRFAGHCKRWWSVLQHCFVVADLVEQPYKKIALLHDSSEILISDIPTPFKNKELKKLEDSLLKTIFKAHLGTDSIPADVWNKIKIADSEAFAGEVWTISGPALRALYPDRSPTAEKLVKKYLKRYPVSECLSSEGTAVMDFIRRVSTK